MSGYDVGTIGPNETRLGKAYWESNQAYGYDLDERLTSASHSQDRVLGFGYDAFGRRVSQSDSWHPEWGSLTFDYDAAGRRTAMTYGDGVKMGTPNNPGVSRPKMIHCA